MQTVLRRLGNVRIPRRVGLAAMTFAAILPVGLSAVGNAESAKTAAFVGVPVVLLAALAWRGNKPTNGTKTQVRRVFRQKQAVVFAFSALLFSIVLSDWPRDVAIYGSVALNQATLEKVCEHKPSTGIDWALEPDAEKRCYMLRYNDFIPYSDGHSIGGVCLTRPVRIGLVTVSFAAFDCFGNICLYTEAKDGAGQAQRRCIYYTQPIKSHP